MINNNPYNIPERPHKQKKVVFEASPLNPHQINRGFEDIEPNQRQYPHKKNQITFFLDSTVSQASRIPMSPQPVMRSHTLQMSSVTQWDGQQSGYKSQVMGELSEKLSIISARLDSHQKKLTYLLQNRKQLTATTNLSESVTYSIDSFSPGISKQMQRYHSTEEAWDKMREQFISYRSQNQKLGEDLRAQIHEQKDTITNQLISSFKESLQQKFDQEEAKIAEFLTEFTLNQKEELGQKIKLIKQELKEQWGAVAGTLSKHQDSILRTVTEIKEMQAKQQMLMLNNLEFQSSYKHLKEETMDHILATQDHKRWLYEIDSKIESIKHNLQQNQQYQYSRGNLKVSTEYCMQRVWHLRYQQYISIAQKASEHSLKSIERIYLIDEQGYLLDSNKFYIIDNSGAKIKLSEFQIQKLKSEGLLR